MRPRIIPCLLLKGRGLIKGRKFASHKYVGDPVNAVNIFNAKDVDELVFLDIEATRQGRSIPLSVVEQIADECYMPFAVGGGVADAETARRLLYAGAEKVVVNTACVTRPQVIAECARVFGSQAVVAAVDVVRVALGEPRVVVASGGRLTDIHPVAHAKRLEALGAGEILLTSIERDGAATGYDLPLVRAVAEAVSVPVIAAGGARSLADCRRVVDAGASAAAAGSLFVFYGPKRAVLISYPEDAELAAMFPADDPAA